jgi:hypothetical protein
MESIDESYFYYRMLESLFFTHDSYPFKQQIDMLLNKFDIDDICRTLRGWDQDNVLCITNFVAEIFYYELINKFEDNLYIDMFLAKVDNMFQIASVNDDLTIDLDSIDKVNDFTYIGEDEYKIIKAYIDAYNKRG